MLMRQGIPVVAVVVWMQVVAADQTQINSTAQPTTNSPHSSGGQTSVTNTLNAAVARNPDAVFTGGKGVLVRNPFDGLSDDTHKAVVPGTYWVNDIFTMSALYPGGNGPQCPSEKYHCTEADGAVDPWTLAGVAFVIGTSMGNVFTDFDNVQDPHWGWGVFYPYDSNAVDKRCRYWADHNGYDCPGGWLPWGGEFQSDSKHLGAGSYNFGSATLPGADDSTHPLGGGAGCHFEPSRNNIDQVDGKESNLSPGLSLVGDQHCQCNYAFKSSADPQGYDVNGNGWDAWVDRFHESQNVFGADNGASWNVDIANCWVNNVRDMINMQNWLWWKRTEWNKGFVPIADYSANTNRYWGWNEVPVSREVVQNVQNWDAVIIMLPAFLSTGPAMPLDLSTIAKDQLDKDLGDWTNPNHGYMVPGLENAGKRPGSYVSFVRQNLDPSNQNWEKEFFCAELMLKSFAIRFKPITADDPTGACWLDYAAAARKYQMSEDNKVAEFVVV